MNENELIDAAVSTGESTNCNDREGVYIYTFDSFQLEQFAQRIQPQWFPIESAPKDRRIIVARAGHPWIHVCYWSTRWNHWANGPSAMDYFAAPTHWMESIAPPEGNP